MLNAQSVRVTFRGLRRARSFTITTVTILAAGIGVAIAMLSVMRSVLTRPLPVRDQQRVAVLWTYQDPAVEFGTLRQDLDAVKRSSRTLSDVAGVVHWGAPAAPMLDGDRPVVMNRSLVTGNFFSVLGVRPLLGRLLRAEDEVPGASNVIVLSSAAWHKHFGGDPNIVGRQLTEPYQRTHYTVIGVAPPGLDYPAGVAFWIPFWPHSEQQSVFAVGRLAPTATLEDARAEFLATVKTQNPTFNLVGAKAVLLEQVILGDVRPVLLSLGAAAALLLLIACVNVGNLFLLRGVARAREIAVRRALGATTGALLAHSVLESVWLGAVGGALGYGVAQLCVRTFLLVAPTQLPRSDLIEVAGLPAVLAIGGAVIAAVLFGIVPTVVASRAKDATSLRLDARTGRSTAATHRLRQLLVGAQMALALVMLAGAALLAHSLFRLLRLDLGYKADNLAIVSLAIPVQKYPKPDQWFPLGEQIMQRWRAIPGVSAVTPTLIPPFVGANVFVGRVDLEGQTQQEREKNPVVPLEVGGAEYFRTMGIPIVRGRGLLDSDREGAPLVAVVSQSVARKLWPNQDPIGKRISYWVPDSTQWRTVVGVAGDIHFRTLRESTPSVYLSWRQANWQMQFAMRTNRPFPTLVSSLRREAAIVEPQLSIWDARTMDEHLAAPLAQPRVAAMLMLLFAAVALLLSAIGLYGVIAAIVREQTREIGIRMALGAAPEVVRREVLRHALGVAGTGAAVGMIVTLLGSHVLSKLLFEVSPVDPLALVSAAAVLLIAVLTAAYLPARWATNVDPVRALRSD